MALVLYAHPFSSYCQKVLIALFENGTPFEMRMLDDRHPANLAALEARWPFGKFPLLVDGETTVAEASIIVEHLGLFHPGPVRLLPEAPAAALEVRMMDRVLDNFVATPQQRVVVEALRPASDRDPVRVAQAKANLETAYRWLDGVMARREWAAGSDFSLADCGAAPFLFYADWTHPIDAALVHLRGYRARLAARPSVARAVEDARPYRPLFPLGGPAPD